MGRVASHSMPAKVNRVHKRWHHNLHPSIHTVTSGNALPKLLTSLIHPTHATLHNVEHDTRSQWTSRSHRKNRYVQRSPRQSPQERHAPMIWHGLLHMLRIEYWNISWWVAISYTTGSIIWVVNGFFVFLPEVIPNMTESTAGSGWTAFLGATVFEFGSLLGILEAWNRDDTTHHGWETEEKQTPTTDKSHHDSDSDYPENGSNQSSPRNRPSNQWKWFSTQRKYWHELGFLAAAVQFVAATIFWISGFTSIPSIHDSIDDQGLLDGVFWSPQVVGGAGFILSSVLMVIETQKKWFVPAPLNIGWQVGSWNLVGSVGFTLCGALGYAANTSSRAMYQSSLSTFWGGWAFLIGSLFQWYESVNSLS